MKITNLLIAFSLTFGTAIQMQAQGWEREINMSSPTNAFQSIEKVHAHPNGSYTLTNLEYDWSMGGTYLTTINLDNQGFETSRNTFIDPYTPSWSPLRQTRPNAAGNGYVTLTVFGTTTHLLHTDVNGNLTNDQAIDLTNPSFPNDFAIESGFLVLPTGYLIKTQERVIYIDTNGNIVWEHNMNATNGSSPSFTSNYDTPNSLVLANDGNIWAAGRNGSTLVMRKLDMSTGNMLQSFDAATIVNPYQLAITTVPYSNDVFVSINDFSSASQIFKIDDTGNQVWRTSIALSVAAAANVQSSHVEDIIPASSGDGVVLATILYDNNNEAYPYLFRVGDNGLTYWAEGYLNNLTLPSWDLRAKDVEPATDGGYILTVAADSSTQEVYIIKTDSGGVALSSEIIGNVFLDSNTDCAFTSGETGYQNQVIQAVGSNGAIYHTLTDVNGDYQMQVEAETYTVSATSNILFAQPNCQNGVAAVITGPNQTQTVDFPYEPLINCPYLTVDVSTSFLRRCIQTPDYVVNFCNYGTVDASNAYVEVTLPADMVLNSSSIPGTLVSGNTYSFQLGTVAINDCGSFTLDITLDPNCDQTWLGQTHCVEAHIYPDIYNCGNNWNGAIIEAEANCINGDTAEFRLENVGAAMGQALNYYVIEDNIILRTGTYILGAGQDTVLRQPTIPNATYRIEAQQEQGFPFYLGDSIAWATVEGCNDSSWGWWTQFNTINSAPFLDVDCRTNIGSYDPNDKQAIPVGYGANHYIEEGQTINYTIRFQNTGSDTAFTVVIEDQLTDYLDVNSIQFGASSHPYTANLSGNGLLRFTFNDIMLVDSTTNEPESHGFVSFTIDQVAGNPVGTVINNTAAIYFDMNAPIITNTTFHEINEDFVQIELSTEEIFIPQVSVNTYPNPFTQQATVEIDGIDAQNFEFILYDVTGRMVRQQQENSNQFTIDRGNLGQGVYLFQIQAEGQLLSTGKLIVQ